jgi:negative regulator of flagellin synthesis FlgM
MNSKIDGIGNGPGSMRVDAQPRRTGSPEEQQLGAITPAVGLRLGNDSVELRAARQSQPSEPSVDANRVEKLRAAIESGDYKIDPQAVAARLMDIEGSLR